MNVCTPINIDFTTDQDIQRYFRGTIIEIQEGTGLIVDSNTHQVIVNNIARNVETNCEDGEAVILAGHRCVFNLLDAADRKWCVTFTEYRQLAQ